MAKYGEWDQLVNLTVDPKDFLSADDYYRAAVPTAFLRKCQGLPITTDPKLVAKQAFFTCERQNTRTNARLSKYLHNGPFDPREMRISNFLETAKKLCRSILGPLPRDLQGKFGKGSTLMDVGELATIPDKMSSRPTVTGAARCLLPIWERTAWARALCDARQWYSDPETVRGNRFTTVPKDSTKDRGICVEPSINIFLQLAVGGVLRQRLKAAGIDIRTAQTLHRELARAASVSDRHATIDLSNASDTLCYNLVRLVLPPDWFELLDSLRSTHTQLDGKQYLLQKFSSMGNGFTFELETLVFLVLAWTVSSERELPYFPGFGIWVYGDDIIVDSSIAVDVVSTLCYFGFAPNSNKTFLTGSFKESCGGDYFEGVDVRPFNLKEIPCEPHEWISLTNGIRRLGYGHHKLAFWRGRFRRCWMAAMDPIPSNIRRLRGPSSLGDLVINDERGWTVRTSPDDPQQRHIRGWVPVPVVLGWHHWNPACVLAAALYGCPEDGVTPRHGGVDAVSGYREKWLALIEEPLSE
nr:MAG: RNA replicase beta chain [Sanya fiers-like virus 3]